MASLGINPAACLVSFFHLHVSLKLLITYELGTFSKQNNIGRGKVLEHIAGDEPLLTEDIERTPQKTSRSQAEGTGEPVEWRRCPRSRLAAGVVRRADAQDAERVHEAAQAREPGRNERNNGGQLAELYGAFERHGHDEAEVVPATAFSKSSSPTCF